MAVIGNTLPTLVDVATRTDPTGAIVNIAEIMQQRNEVLLDVRWKEGNLPTGHMYTQRVGLPEVYFRLINQGVPPSKSVTTQVTEQTAMIEGRSQVDVKLARINGNTAAWRLSEVAPFLEAMTQKFVRTIFYGNAGIDPEQFTGLAPRYSSLTAGNGSNILDAGGTGGDNASIWIVRNSEETFHGTFPKGTTAGLQHKDLGEDDAIDSAGNRFRALMDLFEWDVGVALPDWRGVVRIANIDISNLRSGTDAADLVTMVSDGLTALQTLEGAAIYMNRTVWARFQSQIRSQVAAGGGLTFENIDNRRTPMWSGAPIRIVDQLLNTEARVV